ncbi:MAG: TIR domain-containing protein [Burkholderiales bacterium]|nr:TIR domain-containing protein [Burkholderiales bacterium]
MSFVFVSHAAPDKRSRVRPLVQALAIEGVSLWIDRPGSGPNDFQLSPDFVARHPVQCLRLGQDWDEGIKAALRDAAAVLVCLSRAALDDDREVLRQEMWGAQLTNKAVTCIVDDLDLSTVPAQSGLLSLGKSQSLRIDTDTLERAVAWLEEEAARTPDQLPKEYQPAWQDVRRLRDELHRTRDAPSSRYRWPTPWDFSAYMADKREVFEGRDWLFGEIANWHAASHARALLIRADFGVGKSAIMAELVHRNPGVCIAAWHFCQHDTQETLQPGAFVRSLAAQLATTVPGYQELIDADPDLQERLDRALTDPGSALEGAVLAPLARLSAPSAPRLLLVDALDEALEVDATGPRSTGTIVSLLAAKAGRFPAWLRVLATSRPNPQVLTPLGAFGIKEIDAESVGNQEDLRRYILGRCAREPLAGLMHDEGHAAEPLAELLVQRSLGKFLYAVRAMRDLENRRIGVAELAALPPGMDSFYLKSFDRRFARVGRDYAGARRVLGVLASARESLAAATVATVLGVGEAEVKAVHKALPDFLRLRAGKLAFDHFSMAEWLTHDNEDGFARAGDYAVDVLASQAALRAWALREVEQGLAHRSGYLLRHLPAHLSSNDERQRVCGPLMFESFEWLQARLDQAGVDALMADAQALEGMPAQPLLLALLRNSAHVLHQFPEQLAAQVLGRIGEGQHSLQPLAGLAGAALHWQGDAESEQRCLLLRPISRSLRLSTAHKATLIGGGSCLAVLPDGRIAAGTYDYNVRLWDLAHPGEPLVFEGHSGSVCALAVLPDGRIASGSFDNNVRLWDPTHSGEPLIFEGHSDWILALAVLLDGRIASGSDDNTVRLWHPAHPGEPLVFEGHTGSVYALAVLPDGRIASGSRDNTVRLWDPAHPGEPLVFEGHTGSVHALAVLPNGRIASGSEDNTVRLWDPAHPGEPLVFEGHTGSVYALAVLPDGRIASGSRDNTVRLWDPAHPGKPLVFEGHSKAVCALAVLPDGRIASGSSDKTVRLWDPAHSGEPLVFEGHSGWVIALAVLPDGRIASRSDDNTVRLWDPAHAGEPLVFEGHSDSVCALAVLPDGRIASGSSDNTVRLRDPAHPGKPLVFEGHSKAVNALAVLPDGRIASGSEDNTVRLWDPAHPGEPLVFEGHSKAVNALAVLLDGRIASGSSDSTVRLWDPTRPGEPLVFEGCSGSVIALAVLPDGRIASGSLTTPCACGTRRNRASRWSSTGIRAWSARWPCCRTGASPRVLLTTPCACGTQRTRAGCWSSKDIRGRSRRWPCCPTDASPRAPRITPCACGTPRIRASHWSSKGIQAGSTRWPCCPTDASPRAPKTTPCACGTPRVSAPPASS